MARFYADIGKRFDKFFDDETYQLNRAINMNVDGGKVNWSLKMELDANNKIDSKLTVKHTCSRETCQVETSVSENPKFTLTTNRFPIVNTKFSIKEPKFETELTKQMEKVSCNLKATHNWNDYGWEAEASVCYQGFDNIALGGQLCVDQPPKDKIIGVKEYNLKFEWQRNADQTLVFQTENKLKDLNLGGYVTLRENYIGFAQIGLDRDHLDDLRWKVGMEKRIGEFSAVTGFVRHGGCGSVLYKGRINNFEGQLAFNCDRSKPTAERHSFEYKIGFNY